MIYAFSLRKRVFEKLKCFLFQNINSENIWPIVYVQLHCQIRKLWCTKIALGGKKKGKTCHLLLDAFSCCYCLMEILSVPFRFWLKGAALKKPSCTRSSKFNLEMVLYCSYCFFFEATTYCGGSPLRKPGA